ncbi:MAG: glycosyltransferase [Actinomycetota bacterium]
MKCKICESNSQEFAQAQILNQYQITYFQCTHCHFIQTEEPYWLPEAYKDAIARSDEGLVFRNLIMARISSKIINQFFNPNADFLDYGGGYGLFVRLMRDIRFKFDWYDCFCKNLFAQGLEAKNQSYELVTAFEVVEHLSHPIAEIRQILNFSPNLLFSTVLLPANHPKPGEWWYYALQEGQHIAFYTPKSLSILAEKLGLNFYSNGASLHLFTEKNLSSTLFYQISQYNPKELRKRLLNSRDYFQFFEFIEQSGLPIHHPSIIPKPMSKPPIHSTQNQPFINSILGVNITGYVNGEFGIGEGVRATIRTMEAAGIPFVINNFTLSPHRKLDKTYQNFTLEHPYPINLIQINADEVKNFIKYSEVDYLKGRYNIGFWAWELPTFPPEWTSAFSKFHEIWTYSNHCAEAISRVSPIPVIKMMPSIFLEKPSQGREALGLPKNKFIFLFMFDFFSQMERKNPLAIIEAFKLAFGEANEAVFLVIKSSNSEYFQEQRSRLNAAVANCPSIQHLDGYLSKSEINALLYNCDCYISLHRSEGFGLTMAEAMFYGKPVIATAYSSNTEFMNLSNSFLVKYKLETIKADWGPYKKGNLWAEPDIEHAAALMQTVFKSPEIAQKVGARAAEDIQSILSPQSIGIQVRNRLEYIRNITNDFMTLPQPLFPFIDSAALATPETRILGRESQGKGQSSKPLPLVSICIPTYNGEAFIAEAIQSAFSQTYPNIEVIVSDDGSTDNTIKIAQSFQNQTSIDYRIILHRNYGLAQNWNFCISQAQGQYIKFLFQDDLLAPDCVTQMVELAQQDPEIGLVFSPRGIVMAADDESKPLFMTAYQSIKDLYKNWSNLQSIQWGRELLLDPNFLKNPINKIGEPTTVLIATEVFRKVGLFDASLSQYLDLDMWFRILGHYKIGFVDAQLSSLRIHPGQQTWKNYESGENRQDIRRLYHKMLKSDVYSFLTQELKEQVREKLEGKSNQFLISLEAVIEQYRKSPQTPILDELRQIRQQVAEKWLSLTAEQCQTSYLGELGKAQQLLLESDIKSEVLTAAEQIFVEGLAGQIFQGGVGISKIIHYYLAAMLYCHAYQLPIEYRNAAIPRWFLKDFLKFLLATPSYFQKVGEGEQYANYLQGLITYIHEFIFDDRSPSDIRRYLAEIITETANLTWLLSASTTHLPDTVEKLANIRDFSLKRQGFKVDYVFEKQSSRGPRIRLGILLEKLSHQKETFATIPIVDTLNRTQFEIILYQVQPETNQLVNYCQNRVDKLVQLPQSLSEQVKTIRADNLDILLIGANLISAPNSLVQLCQHRLARLQVTTGGTMPATTGITTIDCHVAGTLVVPEALQGQYRETILSLPGSGLCFIDPIDLGVAKVEPTRSSWGAVNDSVVFLSAANFCKIIPELRETWAKIIATVPQSVLVLCPFRPGGGPYPAIPFFKQMRSLFTEFGIDKKRLVVIKALPSRADLQACLKLADVYLDSFPHTGAASLVESLRAGVPTVVREGSTATERQAAAILRELGLPELVTSSENSYIELSAALGTNPELRQRYRQQLQQQMAGNPKFLDSRAYSAQLGIMLETSLREQQREG